MTPIGHCRTSLTCAYSFLSSVHTDDSAGHTGIWAYLEVWAEPFFGGSDVDGFAADGQLVLAGSGGAVYRVALLVQVRVEGWRAGPAPLRRAPGLLAARQQRLLHLLLRIGQVSAAGHGYGRHEVWGRWSSWPLAHLPETSRYGDWLVTIG